MGPLPPQKVGSWPIYGQQIPSTQDPRGIWIVDPSTGALTVLTRDLEIPGHPFPLAIDRIWSGNEWSYLGASRLSADPQGFLLRRPGLGDLRFDLKQALPMGFYCPDGTRIEHAEGHVFLCGGGRFEILLSSGAIERFDENGHILSRRGPMGGELRYRWDMDRLVGMETDDGRSLTWSERGAVGGQGSVRLLRVITGNGGMEVEEEYDQGRLSSVTTADGVRTRFFYDASGRLSGALWADGSSTRLLWDASSRLSGFSGPGGRRWSLDWDQGGLQRALDEQGGVWRMERRDDGISVTDPTGRSVRLLIQQGEIRGWIDPSGSITRILRTPDGALRGLQDPRSMEWRLRTEPTGLLAELVEPGGANWRYERSRDGWLQRLIGPDGRSMRFSRGPKGAVQELERGNERVTFRQDPRGLPMEIQRSNGSSYRIERDLRGRVVAIRDPTGNSFLFTEHRGPWPSVLKDPGEISIRLLFDPLQRPTGLVPATRDPCQWSFDALGRLSELRRGPARVRFGHRSDGAYTQIRDKAGRTTGWSLDGAGRVVSLRRADGSKLQFQRDPRADLTGIRLGDETLRIERDAMGQAQAIRLAQKPGAASPPGAEGRPLPSAMMTVKRDLRGDVVEIAWPEGVLRIARDLAGRSRLVQFDDRVLELGRDPSGRLVSIREKTASWKIERDMTGMVRAVEGPGLSLKLERDLRSLVTTMKSGLFELTRAYDAAGRLASLRGSGEASLGFAWDPDGEIATTRYPSGVLGWFRWSEQRLERTLENGRGRPLVKRLSVFDEMGRLASVDRGGPRSSLHYGPMDRLVSIEDGELAWSRGPSGAESTTGASIRLDSTGRPIEAFLQGGPLAWGIARAHLRYLPDAVVRGLDVEGEEGEVHLRHDLMGRIVEIVVRSGPRRKITFAMDIQWDPLGIGPAFSGSEGQGRVYSLGGRLAGRVTERARETFLLGPHGLGVSQDARGSIVSIWPDEHGNPAFFLQEDTLTAIDYSPSGFPSAAAPVPLGAGAQLALLPGGPLLGPTSGLDPVSGQATADPLVSWPWSDPPWGPVKPAPWPEPDGATSADWDPAWWQPESPWSDPLRLLADLGLIQVPERETWLEGARPAPLPWLPASLEGGEPPIGPSWWGWPMDLDPVSGLYMSALLEGRLPVERPALLELLLHQELERLPRALPDSGALPGLDLLLH